MLHTTSCYSSNLFGHLYMTCELCNYIKTFTNVSYLTNSNYSTKHKDFEYKNALVMYLSCSLYIECPEKLVISIFQIIEIWFGKQLFKIVVKEVIFLSGLNKSSVY